MASESYAYKHFNVTFPKEYVVHVETNRPEKMNAFIEGYVIPALRQELPNAEH
jgi:hypothetical protein